MKDLYTFDADKDSAIKTYDMVNEIYNKFFKFIGVPFVKCKEIMHSNEICSLNFDLVELVESSVHNRTVVVFQEKKTFFVLLDEPNIFLFCK